LFQTHHGNVIGAYNDASRLKTLSGLTLYEYICKIWIIEPKILNPNPSHIWAKNLV